MANSKKALIRQAPRMNLARIKQPVLESVQSPLTKAMYSVALDAFFAWYEKRGFPTEFDRETVQAFRAHLESQGLSAASVNQKLSAIRKLASEAFYKKALDANTLQGIREVRGAKRQGVRTGNWLLKTEAETLINSPDATTLKGKRDRAILALMVGCGLRRDEVARLNFGHVQQRDGRWCVVDLVGKHGRIRTVPMPVWAKTGIDKWSEAANVTTGAVFRGLTKAGGKVVGESLTAQGIMRCVKVYADKTGVKVAPHDLRRTYAKLAHQGGAKLDQIQLSLGHASLMTTEKYLGLKQNLQDAPCDYLALDVGHTSSGYCGIDKRGSS